VSLLGLFFLHLSLDLLLLFDRFLFGLLLRLFFFLLLSLLLVLLVEKRAEDAGSLARLRSLLLGLLFLFRRCDYRSGSPFGLGLWALVGGSSSGSGGIKGFLGLLGLGSVLLNSGGGTGTG
jgi:hypothetical protein